MSSTLIGATMDINMEAVKNARVGVCGGRYFRGEEYLYSILDAYVERHGIAHIVSGGATGADTFAESYAKSRQIPYTVYPAQWEKHGRSAGFIRNKDIVEDSDIVMAFPTKESVGTHHTVGYAKKQGKPTYVFTLDKELE